MKNPNVSVIVPNYNSSKTIRKCIKAVLSNDYSNFECIVVDDCSTDNSIDLINDLTCKVISTYKNQGPAYARNIGAKNAKGDIIFFVDSDLILLSNAVSEAVKTLRGNKDVGGVIGIYSSIPANNTFVAKVMAIKKRTDFFGVKKTTCISGAITALRKKVFLEFGGFDTRFKGADVEDFDLGHKITEKYSLIFNPKIQGRHYFPGLWKACKNFYKRSSQWFSIFIKCKRFDTGAASKKGAASSITSGLVTPSLFVSALWPPALIIFLLLLSLFILLNKNFFKQSIKQEGTIFVIRSIPVLCILFNAAFLGSALSIPKTLLRGNK